jgi:hypothetical protein
VLSHGFYFRLILSFVVILGIGVSIVLCGAKAGGTTILRDIGNHLSKDMYSHPNRLESSAAPL